MVALSIRPKPISFFELHGQLVAHEIQMHSSVFPAPVANVVDIKIVHSIGSLIILVIPLNEEIIKMVHLGNS